MAAVIGALRAELSASIAAFQSDLGKAAGSLKAFSVEAKAIGAEMQSIGTAMALSITGPLLLLTKAAVDQAVEMRQAMGQVQAALLSTGGASGKTAEGLKDLAGQLESISTFDKSDILKGATTTLLRFGNITGPVFDRAEKAVVNLGARMGGDLAGAALRVGKALNDPIGGLTALQRVGITFTTQQKEQIKALVQNGEGMKAQGIILAALENKFDGAALAMRNATPTAALNQQWRDLKETIGEIVLKQSKPLLDFLERLVKDFNDLAPATQQTIVKFAAIAAVAGPVVAVLGGIINVVGKIAQAVAYLGAAFAEIDFTVILAGLAAIDAPMVLIGVAIAGVVAFVYEFRDVFLKALQDIWGEAQSTLGPAFQQLLASLVRAWNVLSAALIDLWNGPIGDFFRLLLGALADLSAWWLKTVGTFLIDTLATFIGFLSKSVNFIVDDLSLVIHFLSGDWSKAWKDAANVAADAMAFIDDSAKPGGPGKPKGPPLPKPPPPPKHVDTTPITGAGGGDGFDLHNADTIKKLADATKAFELAITGMDQRISHGLDDLNLPKSVSQANALNAQIDDFVKKAQDAGVNTSKWGAQIAALRARIEELKQAGLAKEAKAFQEAVNADQQAVDRFAKGGMDPLTEKLTAVDDAYKSLRTKIQDEIDANKALADSNAAAARSMAQLQGTLASLDDAHKKATAAAIAQYNAEQALADLQSRAQNLETSNQIQDFMAASGRAGGPISSNQENLQQTQRDLEKTQLEAETQLQTLIAKRAAAELVGDTAAVTRLNSQIDLQQQLYDLVANTTAEQIQAAQRINDAFKSFTDSLSSDLTDMVTSGKADFKTLLGDFTKLAGDLFVKPVMDQLSNVVGGLLKNLLSSFAGGFASGGYIPPGQWGVVGEQGAEIARGGTGGMTVYPSGTAGMSGGGVTQVFNISTPDANSFRRSARQIQRAAKTRLGMES